MSLFFCIVLAMQLLLHRGAWSCQEWEYEINGECCPNCGAGYRVSKPCTASLSTSCVPCSQGTYTDHPNGLTACFRCRTCDPGAHLKVKEECTYTKNTVCSCEAGYFCSHLMVMDEKSCEICTKHTVSPPGYKVIQAGTETSDTIFIPCQPGTFSKTEKSSSCEYWTNCSKAGLVEVYPGSASSDAVCGHQKQHITTIVLLSVFPLCLILVVILIVVILRKRKKYTMKGVPRKQEEEREKDYLPVQEGKSIHIPMQETAPNLGEPSYQACA